MSLPAPTLSTARLRLRSFDDADADALFVLHSNAYVLRYWDALSWTENTARSMRDIVNQSRSAGFAGKAEMRITGTATALAKQQMQGLGWTVTDNYK